MKNLCFHFISPWFLFDSLIKQKSCHLFIEKYWNITFQILIIFIFPLVYRPTYHKNMSHNLHCFYHVYFPNYFIVTLPNIHANKMYNDLLSNSSCAAFLQQMIFIFILLSNFQQLTFPWLLFFYMIFLKYSLLLSKKIFVVVIYYSCRFFPAWVFSSGSNNHFIITSVVL